jgi:TetR/AcrR family transcriptional regulator
MSVFGRTEGGMEKRDGKVVGAVGEAKARFLGGATDLFASKGYAATAVREIVERAGRMAKGERKGAESGGEVRGRLLSGATDLFASKGYAATTVREIVERAGVTKPVLYYYFGNKEGIYLELMREAFGKFVFLVEETVREAGSAKERLFRLCLRGYDIFIENLDVARVMFSIYYGPPQGAPFVDFDAYHRQLQGAVLQVLQDGIRSGEFRPVNPEDAVWAVLGAVNVATEVELCHPSQSLGRDGVRRILEIVLEGIASGGKAVVEKGRRI